MLKIRNIADLDVFESPPAHWPPKEHYANQHAVRRDQCEALRELLAMRASERAIEQFLADNREVLALVAFLYSTGHHAAWIYPKHQLRPPPGSPGGIIPDYVLAGANSDGVRWFILELKGANHSAFVLEGKRVSLSRYATKGVCQLLSYMDVATRSQGYLRDEIKLTGFREPRGILMIGTEEESSNENVREFKGAWNRMNPHLQIRSYSALLRMVEAKLRDFRR